MKRWRKWAWVLVPACASVLILLAAYARHGVYPFGDKVSFYWDGKDQFFPFLSAYRNALLTGRDVGYSLNTLFGMDLVALFAYYLASPLHLLVLLFPAGSLADAYLLIILLKVGISAGAFFAYARRSLRADRLIAVLCATGYALMGWVAAYSYFIMWLDALIWLPLICMGIHALIERGRYVGLTLAYCALFFSSYYFGFMVAAFSVLYCATLIALRMSSGNWRRLLGRGAMLVAGGLLAVGMVAFLIVPALLWTLEGMNIIGADFPRLDYTRYLWEQQFSSLVAVIPALLSGVNRDPFEVKLFFGIAPLLMSAGFFCDRGVPMRKRLVAGSALLLLFYSMQNNWLNLLWHLGEHPTGFTFRQSFVLSFAMLVLAVVAGTALRRGDTGTRQAVLRASLAMLGVVLTYNGLVRAPLAFWHYTVNLVLVAGSAALLWAIGGAKKRRVRIAVAAALMALMAADLYNNANQVFATFGFSERTQYRQELPVQELVRIVRAEETGLYRIGDEGQRTPNDGLLYAYPAGDHFSSTNSLPMLDFANAIGFDNMGWRYCTRYRSNIIADAILGFRYVLPTRMDDAVYPTEHTPEGTPYQRNSNALPFLFVSAGSFEPIEQVAEWTRQQNEWELLRPDMLGAQQALLRRVAPGATCMAELAQETADAQTATFVCIADGPVYLYPPYGAHGQYAVWWNDAPVEFAGLSCELIGVARPGDRIRITAADAAAASGDQASAPPEASDWRAAQVDQAAFAALCADIQRKTARVERPSDTVFTATVEAGPGDKLFITLPYTAGWTIEVDGQPAKLEPALHVFMGAEIQPGIHEIRLAYARPGQRLGTAISVASWLLLAACVVCGRLFACRHRRVSGIPAPL